MRLILPILLLGACALGAWYLVENKVEAEKRPPRSSVVAVEVQVVKKVTKRLFVKAFGTVRPRTMTTLIAEAAGKIEAVAPFVSEEANRTGPQPSFRAGGFFDKGDLLVKIDDVGHQAMSAEAEAALRRAELQLEQERALAEQAKIEWVLDRDWETAPELVKRVPQIKKAETDAKATEARLNQATQILERTEVRAPYQGRFLQTMADVGQQVGAGSSPILAMIYALKSAEIDLALNQRDLDLLNFSEIASSDAPHIEVQVMEGNSSGHIGLLDRSEGTIDPRTRLTKVIARVDQCFANPFAIKDTGLKKPLSPGQFVEIKLLGPNIDVFLIPFSALRDRNSVLVVTEDDKLLPRLVEVVNWDDEFAWTTGGLKDGEKICLTPIEIFAAGMKVKPTNMIE
jgi:RND family efflux transporter MFP subunit